MKRAAKIIIQGTVQGVFFRQFCKENAEKLNIKGFVRNLENSNVEIIAEGDSENMLKFIEILRKGPAYAQIRNVNVEEKKYSGDLKDFKVLRI